MTGPRNPWALAAVCGVGLVVLFGALWAMAVVTLSQERGGAEGLVLQPLPQLAPGALEDGGWPVCNGPDREARRLSCVVDGDTFWVDGLNVRLSCIDAPELDADEDVERWRADLATRHLSRVLVQPDVRLVLEGRQDRFGRDLGTLVWVDGASAVTRSATRDMVLFSLARVGDYPASRAFCARFGL